jgi:hypothetical protein
MQKKIKNSDDAELEFAKQIEKHIWNPCSHLAAETGSQLILIFNLNRQQV